MEESSTTLSTTHSTGFMGRWAPCSCRGTRRIEYTLSPVQGGGEAHFGVPHSNDNVAQNCKAEIEQYLENNKKLIPHYYKVPQPLCFWDGEENF
jgi:hypothetical protein